MRDLPECLFHGVAGDEQYLCVLNIQRLIVERNFVQVFGLQCSKWNVCEECGRTIYFISFDRMVTNEAECDPHTERFSILIRKNLRLARGTSRECEVIPRPRADPKVNFGTTSLGFNFLKISRWHALSAS